MAAGESTSLSCPECGEESCLVSRPLGAVQAAAMECPRCGGLWLGSEVFQKLVDQAAAETTPQLASKQSTRSELPVMHDETEWRYRTCPLCRELMPRQHYGRGSGVIVDLCRGHGLWFDANELPRILDWIRRGGLQKAQRRCAEAAREAQRRQDLDRNIESRREWLEAHDSNARSHRPYGLLNDVLDGLSHLFS